MGESVYNNVSYRCAVYI